MGEYKELNIGKDIDKEEDFKIIIEEDDVDNNKALEEEDVKGGEPEGEKKVEPKAKPQEDRKPSRAEKRIKELHQANKEKDERLAAMAEELENFKKTQNEGTKVTKQEMKSTLETTIDSLNGRLIKAMEEGDTATTVAVQNELLKTSNKLHDLTKELDNFKPYEPKKVQTNQQPKVSEKAVQWIEANPDFNTDEVFQAAALAVNRRLIVDGWDADSEEFYEEVTERLKVRFPEKFGETDKNSVELETENKPSSEKTKNKSQRHVEQTVSGASRTPSTTSDGKPAHNKKNTITLTTEDVRLAKKWNMAPEQFAKRKLALQNKERGDYIEINTGA